MALISEQYREMNEIMHRDKEYFGKTGCKFAPMAMQMSVENKTTDILDYGCGKGTLANHLPFPIKQYDPAVPKFSKRPEPADIVFCTEVMEHVEPECIDEVLDDIQRCTKALAVISISTRPAEKHLPDGRNAHLVIKPLEWWASKLMSRWQTLSITVSPEFGFTFIGMHK